jgi:hypothetical protein
VSITAATQHAADQPMIHDAIQVNVDRWRTWLNQLAVAEVQDASVQREKIVRPQVRGFPLGGLEGENDIVLMRPYGIGNAEANLDDEWGRRRERLVIPMQSLSPGESHRTPIGATLYVPRTAHLHFVCTLEWQWRATEGFPGPGILYPDGVGGGSLGGTLALWKYTRAGGSPPEQIIMGSSREAYPMETPVLGNDQTRSDYATMYASATFAAGYYDVSLQFVKAATAAAGIVQLTLGRIMLKLEAHL